MGIFLRLISHDDMYRSGDIPTTIINDIVDVTEEQKQNINQTLYTTNGDVYNNVPSCSCGMLKGKFRLGEYCENCNTEVRESVEDELVPYVYIRKPHGVSKLVNPKVWMLLRNKLQFSKGKFDLIKYLTDPYYEPEIKSSENINSVLLKLDQAGLDIRNYNNFINRFYEYMDFLFELKEFKGRVKGPKPELYDFIMENKEFIFSDYIPVLNKTLLVVEKTNVGSYVDQQLTLMIDAIRLMTGIDVETNAGTQMRLSTKMTRTSRCLCLLSDFYYKLYKNFFSPKTALLRRHIGGTRVDFSFRTVISSNTDPHTYDELHIPWSAAISVLRLHIVNKLLKRGFCPKEISHYLVKYALEYDELLDNIFQELIDDAKGVNNKGIPCICNRNPSLLKGSIMRCYITKVKTDTNDSTTSISSLITGNLNADFDGDEMNFMLLLDNDTDKRLHLIAPEANCYSLSSLNTPSPVLNLTKQVASSIQNWLDAIDEVDSSKLDKMALFQTNE